MLSFERVLEAFREHLTEDTGVEVVPTRHGYTYLTWDDRRENWDTAEICLTPEALLDRLTGAVESYEQCRLLDGTRDPTDALNGPDPHTIRKNRHEKQSFGAAFCYAEKEKNEYDTP